MIRSYGQSLAPQDRSKHRAWIGVRVKALLMNYWHQTPDDATLSLMLADWLDELDHFTAEEITDACRKWVSREPRRRPNFGDISALVVAGRAERRATMPKPPEPEQRPTPENVEERRAAAARIMAGFAKGKRPPAPTAKEQAQ